MWGGCWEQCWSKGKSCKGTYIYCANKVNKMETTTTNRNNICIPTAEVDRQFRKYFGVSLFDFKDTLLMIITHHYKFDILGFDKYCHQLGYSEEKHGSLSDFITKKYGEDARKLVVDLIRFQ